MRFTSYLLIRFPSYDSCWITLFTSTVGQDGCCTYEVINYGTNDVCYDGYLSMGVEYVGLLAVGLLSNSVPGVLLRVQVVKQAIIIDNYGIVTTEYSSKG